MLPSLIRTSRSTVHATALLCLWSLGAAGVSAQTPAPSVKRAHAGADATQRVALKAGPNLVSLFVDPAEADLEALFGKGLDNVISVRDEEGRVFAPTYDVRTLTRWENGEAYLVHVRRPMTWEVSGRQVEAETEIALEEGWNSVAFLYPRPVATDSALASIAGSLSRIEAADGRVYPAVGGRQPLTHLEPGVGYRVRVSRPATLVYADGLQEEAPPLPDADVTVRTIDDALDLEGLVPGQTVGVLGYYAAGDGGGGLFEVVESGAAPDGGTVFVPTEHQSEEVTEVGDFSPRMQLGGAPDGENVVFGSLTLDLLDRASSLVLSIPSEHLHGHTFKHSRNSVRPLFSYESGELYDYAGEIRGFLNRVLGSYNDVQVRFTYRHTTSGLRLERQDVGSELDVTWFGARTESESPGFDNQPVINQALNVAQAMNEADGSVRTVVFPKAETYGYFGSIEIPGGLTIRGGGGTYLATATDDLGNTYRPVRVRDVHTRLQVLDGEALKHIRMLRPTSDPHHLPPDVKFALDTRVSRITPANNSMYAGLEDIVLDGNWEGNLDAWREWGATKGELETWLRNAPGWSGLTATNHGKTIPLGQEIVVRNVAILGYAATGILGYRDNTWTAENLLLGNVLYNHAMYGTSGTFTNLTLTGFAWGHAAWYYGKVNNMVYEGGAPSPIGRYMSSIFGIRGGDAYNAEEITHGVYRRDDGTVLPLQTEVVGFYFDFRGADGSTPFAGIGSNISFRGVSAAEPGVLISPRGIYTEEANGLQKALYHSNRIEDVVIYDLADGRMEFITGHFNVTDAVVRNVRVERAGRQANRSFTFSAGRRRHPAWDTPQVQLFEDVHDGPALFLATASVSDDDPAGMDIFIRNSSFDNQTNTLYKGRESGVGELDRFDGDPSKLRVYMENVSFNLVDPHPRNLELFFATTRFRGCTDERSGRTSESSVTLRASDFDGLEALVPLGLLWTPQDSDFVEFGGDGASRIASWEVVGADGDPLGLDKRDPHVRVRLSQPLGSRTITIDAAVRPWEDGVAVPTSLR